MNNLNIVRNDFVTIEFLDGSLLKISINSVECVYYKPQNKYIRIYYNNGKSYEFQEGTDLNENMSAIISAQKVYEQF